MGNTVSGAAIGAGFELFFRSVIDAVSRVTCFSSDLNRMRLILAIVGPTIDYIACLNKTRALFDEAESLVHKCSRVNYWNVFKKLYYSRKLSKLEASLVLFFQVEVVALHYWEWKRQSVALGLVGTACISRAARIPACPRRVEEISGEGGGATTTGVLAPSFVAQIVDEEGGAAMAGVLATSFVDEGGGVAVAGVLAPNFVVE